MPRRGRNCSSPQAVRRATPINSTLPVRTTQTQSSVSSTTPSAMSSTPEQPSIFKQMAATAGGVAVGSAVGHAVGAGITGLFSGGPNHEPSAAAQQQQQPLVGSQQPNELQEPCAWEIKQFLQCAQNQTDLTICEGFNEALRQCKQQNHIKNY